MQFKDKNFNLYLSRNLFSSYYRELQPFLLRTLRYSRLCLIKKNRILLLYIQIAVAKYLTGCYKAIQDGKGKIKRLKNKIKNETNQQKKVSLEEKLEGIQIRYLLIKTLLESLKQL